MPSPHTTAVTVAIISLVGVVVTALFSNWDKIFPIDPQKESSVPNKQDQAFENKIQFVALSDVNIREEPAHNSSIVKTVKCGSIVETEGANADQQYMKVANGFIEKTQLATLESINNISLYCNTNFKINPEDMYGTWIQQSVFDSSDPVKLTFLKNPKKDDTILYDGLYNGYRSSFKSIGGKYEKSSLRTPITWNISSNKQKVTIELWTEVTEKGYRMKWDLNWNLISFVSNEIILKQKFQGLDELKIIKLTACKNIDPDDGVLLALCNN